MATSHKRLGRDLVVGLGKEKGQERSYYVPTPSPRVTLKL